MASFRKRGSYQWQAQIRKRGYPLQTRTFDTRAEAETWARAIEVEMDRGSFVSRTEAESTTLKELLERYLE
ncbi:MAG: site-specific integrase, partial [Gammaproteobacteria bacterium]|nr:site-specific integrase [Gammaproteobacteria bacterium]